MVRSLVPIIVSIGLRGFDRCFDRCSFHMGHVELQRRLQVDVFFVFFGWLIDDEPGGRRFGRLLGRLRKLVDQREFGRGFARYRGLFVVRCRQVRQRRDLLHGVGWQGCNPLCRRRHRELVDQRELGGGFARHRRLFVIRHRNVFGSDRSRRRRHQRHQPDIRAGADALQHHVADADRRLDAALLQRVAARLVQTGLGEIAKAEQRSRSVAGADEHAVAREGRDRRIDAFDQALQPFDQRHRAARPFCGRDQDAVVAVGEFEPRAAAGHQGAERRAKTAQPLQPDRAGGRQPPGELRHLAPVLVRGAENPAGKHGAVGCAEQPGPHRIGPQNPSAVDRPQPDRQRAGRMQRQPGIADASQLEFRMVHRGDWLLLDVD